MSPADRILNPTAEWTGDDYVLRQKLERFQFSLTHILNLRNSWRIRLS
jgi:hypothetical protein